MIIFFLCCLCWLIIKKPQPNHHSGDTSIPKGHLPRSRGCPLNRDFTVICFYIYIYTYILSGAHNPERATSMYTCHGLSRTSLFLERFWNEFRISFKSNKPVSKTYRPKNDKFCLLMTLSFPF